MKIIHSSCAISKNTCITVISLTSLVIVFLLPLWILTSIDEEEFRYAIVSSVLHIKALATGQYPLWTHYLGFGMPHPLLINFNYHPLLPLFFFNTNVAIQSIYLLHIVLGSMGIFLLCRLFSSKYIALVATVTFILSSPSINYLYTDFWITTFVGWSLLPWLYYISLKFIVSVDKKEIIFWAILLSYTLAFLVLNSHPSQALVYFFSLVLLWCTYWKTITKKVKYIFSSLFLLSIIVSGKIYYTFTEATRFTSELTTFKEKFLFNDLWGVFLRPFIFAEPSEIVRYNLDVGSRGLFIGGLFVLAAIATAILYWKIRNVKQFSYNLLVLSSIYLIRPDFIYHMVSTANVFREPLIIILIVLATIGFSRLSNNPKNFTWLNLILGSHICILFLAFAPYWYQLIIIGINNPDYPIVLKNVINSKGAIEKIRSSVSSSNDRLYLTDKVVDDFGTKKLGDLGISLNSLAFHGFSVVNGYFKGISYEEACQGPYIYGKLINDDNCFIENTSFLDIGSVDYIIKYDGNDFTSDSLEKVVDVGEGPNGAIGLYKNLSSWNDAVLLSPRIIDLAIPRRKHCKGTGIGCLDLSFLSAFILKHKPVSINRNINSITIMMSEPVEEMSVLMISEFAHDGWRAKWYSDNQSGDLKIQKIAGFFIGIPVPENTNKIVLKYSDFTRKYLEMASIIIMSSLTFFLAFNYTYLFKLLSDNKN